MEDFMAHFDKLATFDKLVSDVQNSCRYIL